MKNILIITSSIIMVAIIAKAISNSTNVVLEDKKNYGQGKNALPLP